MSYSSTFVAEFGASQTGKTMHGQLYGDDTSASGSAIESGIDEISSSGTYLYTHGSIPDDHRGVFRIYDSSDSTLFIDFVVSPEDTGLNAILATIKGATFDTSTDSLEALRNRGDVEWSTATGFSTHNAEAVRVEMDGNSTRLASIEADTNELQSDDVPAALLALEAHGDSAWSTVTGFSTFDHTSDEVITDAASRNASKANLTGISTLTQAQAIDAARAAIQAEEPVEANITQVASLAVSDIDDFKAASVTVDAASIADAVWDEATAGHTAAGTFGLLISTVATASAVAQAVWQYAARTLTDTSALANSVVSGLLTQVSSIKLISPLSDSGHISITIGTTVEFTISQAFPATWEYIEFVIKERVDIAISDDDAILKAIVYADSSDGGLIVLNEAPVIAGNTDVVITPDQPNNSTSFKITDTVTGQLQSLAKMHVAFRWVDSGSDSIAATATCRTSYIAAEGG